MNIISISHHASALLDFPSYLIKHSYYAKGCCGGNAASSRRAQLRMSCLETGIGGPAETVVIHPRTAAPAQGGSIVTRAKQYFCEMAAEYAGTRLASLVDAQSVL